MRDVQKFLLKLVEEIDLICRNNGIEYYIFAGSMLGVERNEGFLPWDDDMDVVMTRENYEKFRKIIESELPPNRVFEEKCIHKEYPLTFGKYTSTDTTNIIRSLAYGNCAAGLWIDIMHLAPMPTNKKQRKWVRDYFPVYFELYNDLYIGYNYRERGFYKRYKTLHFISRLIGKDKVLHYLKKKFDAISEEECEDYYLFHALDADFRIFSKECFGEPKRAKFENTMVNISPQNRKLCREAYGDNWMMIPDIDNQDTHLTITDCSKPYSVYKRDFMQFLDSDQVLREYSETKQMHVKWHEKKEAIIESRLLLESKLKAIELDDFITSNNVDLYALLKEHRYTEIGEVFSDYFDFQWSSQIKNNGIYVPISDDFLFVFLLYLIAEKQQFYIANKLLSLRKVTGEDLPEYFYEISFLISQLRFLSIELWDNKNYTNAYEICCNNKLITEKYEIKDFLHGFCISAFELGSESFETITNICEQLMGNNDDSGVPEKILGDINIKKGNIQEALQFYKIACDKLRNGLLLKDVKKSVEDLLYND